jgi:hypothetical protein
MAVAHADNIGSNMETLFVGDLASNIAIPTLEAELATRMTSKAKLPKRPQRDSGSPRGPRLERSVPPGGIPEPSTSPRIQRSDVTDFG